MELMKSRFLINVSREIKGGLKARLESVYGKPYRGFESLSPPFSTLFEIKD